MTTEPKKTRRGYTIVRDLDTNLCVKEFYGHCERCWLQLTPEERAVLRGVEPPIVETRREVTDIKHVPPLPVRIADFLWRVGMTGAVTYLVWRSL